MLFTFEAVKHLVIPVAPVLELGKFQALSTFLDAKDKHKQGICGPAGGGGSFLSQKLWNAPKLLLGVGVLLISLPQYS